MSKAYTYYIDPANSGPDEDNSVHITSPSWVLTFVRWQYRDTYRINETVKNNLGQNPNASTLLKATLEPLVVINDCISVNVTSNKNTFTPNMEATLLQTDVNYLTAIAPGDFVLVNMVNWESQATDIYNRAHGPKVGNINNFNDGFKGIFKIASVRRTVAVIDSETGRKGVIFSITGFAFTEFNNLLYFDPSVASQTEGIPVFASQISSTWTQLISANKNNNIQDLIKTLIRSFIGTSSPKNSPPNFATSIQAQIVNDRFFMPGVIGKLLAVDEVTTAADIYDYWFGLQQYSNTGSNVQPQVGLNPELSDGLSSDGFYYTPIPIAGRALLAPEYWNQVKAWDVLNQYANKPLNEFFTCFRTNPEDGTTMPTVVLRQRPFTNEDFFSNNPNVPTGTALTRFLTLPRWKVSPALVISQDIGRDDSLRVNYVQVFAKLLQGGNLGSDYTRESANHNYKFDTNDIQRSGLRPAISASMFDLFGQDQGQPSFNSPTWAAILADEAIGGHLKFSGTFVCAGIPQPIAVGDNFEFEEVVYHIEQVSHSCSINPGSGIKSFRTMISVSSGISIYSSKQNGLLYPEMNYTNAYAERDWDYNNSKILPGVSESQAVPYRLPNVDNTAVNPAQPNTSLPQPKQVKVIPDQPNPKNNTGQT